MPTMNALPRDYQWPRSDVCAGFQCPITDKCLLFKETGSGLTTWHWWAEDEDECDKYVAKTAA